MYGHLPFVLMTLLCCAQLSAGWVENPGLNVSSGHVERLSEFNSRHVSPRNIDVWLPESYDPTCPHAVIYMYDGQMLFDGSITWNKQEWRVDEVLTTLVDRGLVEPCIVVGIWNSGERRHSEYMPEKALAFLDDPTRQGLIDGLLVGESRSDSHLRFLVEELKPEIDRRYTTLREREHTFVMGSSMGGLASLYALCEYPQVFGGAACLSTHWLGKPGCEEELPEAYLSYLKSVLPVTGGHGSLYFDHGTESIDAAYGPYQKAVDDLLTDRGGSDLDWITHIFPGHHHNEEYWAKRLHVPLRFLLARPAAQHADEFQLDVGGMAEGTRVPEVHVYKGYGCAGENVSPRLSWQGAPIHTKSFALTVFDPDAPREGGWWHWRLIDLPADLLGLPENAGDPSAGLAPVGSVELLTDFGRPGYGGPCPPAGHGDHRYEFTLYALDVAGLSLGEAGEVEDLHELLERHTLATDTRTLVFGR